MSSRMQITPLELNEHKIAYLCPGYAPAVVTTISPSGSINIATFDQVMPASYRPPRILLSITPTSDTYKNIQDGSDCVIGFPRQEHVQMVYDCGVKAPREVSKLELIKGITTYPSTIVTPPSLDQCWINMECTPKEVIPAGDHHVLLLDIVSVSIEEQIWHDSRVERRNNLPAVYYTTSGWFFTSGDKFHVGLSEELHKFGNKEL